MFKIIKKIFKKATILSLSLLMVTVFSCKKDTIAEQEQEEFDLFPKEYQEQGEAFLKENMMLSDIINQNNYYTSKKVISYLEENNIILKYNTYENLRLLDKNEDEINSYIGECLEGSKTIINLLTENSKFILRKAISYIFKEEEDNLKKILKDITFIIEEKNERYVIYEYISKVYYNYLSK